MSHKPHADTVRALAAQAKVTVDEAILRLMDAGFAVQHPTNKLTGQELRAAREALGLRAWGEKPPPAERLRDDELVVRMLRPLREKGKLARNHHTEIANVWGHGVPPHQKDRAQQLTEEFLREGLLGEKRNVGQRHVWLTLSGLALLAETEARMTGGDR
jgi:hypothetical protein